MADPPKLGDSRSPNLERSHDPYAALRIANYRRYVSGNALAILGGQMFALAVGWELYKRTNSTTALGLVGLVQIIPILFLAIPAGSIVDRFNRKTIILIDQLLLTLSALTLGLASLYHQQIPDLAVLRLANEGLTWLALWFGETGVNYTHPHVPLMFLLLFVNGVIRSINQPAKQSLLPQLVPQAVFPNAVTWNSSIFETCTMSGPMIAGFALAIIQGRSPDSPWAYASIYFANAAAQLAQFFLFLPITLRPIAKAREPISLSSMLAGLRFVRDTRVIVATISLDMFAVLLGGATALLPVYADRILHCGPAGLGWLAAAPSIGALAMALIVAHSPPMKHAGRNLLIAVAGFGAAIIVFGLSRNIYLSFAALLVTGCCDNISVVIRHTIVQVLTPDAMRGRVSAVNSVFISTSNELGRFESGSVAALATRALGPIGGPIFAVVSGGIGTILVVLGINALFPQVRKIGRLDELKPLEVDAPAGGFEPVLAPATATEEAAVK